MAFGDSLTAGEVTVPSTVLPTSGQPSWRLAVVPSAAYPTVLRDLMGARYTAQAGQITMSNEGIPGDRAQAALARFSKALNSQRPEVVLLLQGIVGLAEEGGASSAALAVATMASEARNRGASVYIATLPPGKPGVREVPNFLIVDYNARMQAVARGEGATLVDLYSGMRGDVSTLVGVDGLHPTEAGYRRMAEIFFQSIRSTLEIR